MTTPAHNLARTRLYLQVEDVDLIIKLVEGLVELPVIADVGAGSGTTALAIFAGNDRAKVFTIDNDAENIDWAKQNIAPYYALYNWEGIVKDSVEAARSFSNEVFDMVLLDTSHEYEYTKREIRAWLSKLRKSGIFWFHDYIGTDVKRAVDESVDGGLLETIAQVGLGWAGKKL